MNRNALTDKDYDDILYFFEKTYESRQKLREPIAKQLNCILRIGGGIFWRGDEDYAEVGGSVNCLFHACYNFPNKVIKTLGLDDFKYTFINPFGEFDDSSIEKTKQEMFDFLRKTGLTIRKNTEILKANERRVALYFSEGYKRNCGSRAFHFALQEKDGLWSAKRGFGSSTVDIYDNLKVELPYQATNKYKLDSVFVIKNPYAPAERQK